MENAKPETTEFLFRRLTEDCPTWAIFVPILFAILVVSLVVIFRPEKKLLAALVGAVVVGVISIVYLPLAYLLVERIKEFAWLVILLPILGAAFFYVVLMYIRDTRSVHFLWAIFLGVLRTTVYLILAVVFMLPGCQHSDKTEYHSRVVILFDVSGSMFVVDDLVEPGKDAKTLLSRQEKIVRLMTDTKMLNGENRASFIDRVSEKSPLFAYRFGPVLDEGDVVNLKLAQKSMPTNDWRQWLNPDKKDVEKELERQRPEIDKLKDEKAKEERLNQFIKRIEMAGTLRSGTNIGGACLQMHKLENASLIQAIIVVSDGQSNVGSDDARTQFLDRVNGPKRTIPVITVGVGQFRLPVSIRIDDINAPEETRPDDPFRVKVPVVSTGIPGEKFKVILEMKRIEDGATPPKVLKDEKTFVLDPKEGVFKGAGDQQQGIVEFEIDLKKITGVDVANETDVKAVLGRWSFKAKVAKHEKEPFEAAFHVSEPVTVLVQQRKLRVLLFAGGATREFQFLSTVLFREFTEKRMEFCVLNQSNVKEDHIDSGFNEADRDRVLQDFPDRIGPNSAGKRFESLSDYDVIVAFDPDWTLLTLKQRKLLKEWVDTHGGGIIFVAGPVYSHQIARPGGKDLNDLLSIYPVVLEDARTHGLGLAGGHDATRPYALNFNPAIKQFDFIKLDEAGESPIAGWKSFFWGREGAMPGPDERPRRGFYTYYPVKRIKVNSLTVASFAGPKETRIGDKTDAFKDQQPFLVTMAVGSGKSLYLSSGELWRLRAHRDKDGKEVGFHERLWIKLFRHVSVGAKEQKKYGRLVMPRVASVGRIEVDAQLKGKDFKPLDATAGPFVFVRKLEKDSADAVDPKDKDKEKDKTKDVKEKDAKGKKDAKEEKKAMRFDLKPRPVEGEEWKGDFYGNIVITEPGDYEFLLPIPGVEGEPPLRQTLTVRKPNPELDNVRTNFGYLYQLASPSDTLLKNMPGEQKKRIESLLQVPEGAPAPGAGDKGGKRLFFPIGTADSIPDCLVNVPPKTDTIKGRFEDLWDQKISEDWPWWVFWPLVLIPPFFGLIIAVIFLILKNWQGALASYVLAQFIGLIPVAIWLLTGRTIEIYWAVILTPLVVGLVGAAILLMLRQWISAPVFFASCGVLSLIGLLFAYQPYASLVSFGMVLGLAAGAYAIVAAFQKEFIFAAIFFVVCSILGGFALLGYFWYLHAHMPALSKSVYEDSLPIGFSAVLIVAVTLVGVEWLTRKLLRLA